MSHLVKLARDTAARFIPWFERALRCSGCGQPPGEGVNLVAGPNLYLCRDCFGHMEVCFAGAKRD